MSPDPTPAPGRFYVDQVTCTASGMCAHVAPGNFAMAEDGYSFYVSRQPETAEQVKAVRRAISECPVEAIFDRQDPRRRGPLPGS